MNGTIIKQMSQIVRDVMQSNQSDFTDYDVKSLSDYDGSFIWFVHPSHTYLCKLSHKVLSEMVETETGLYQVLQRNTSPDAYLSETVCGKDTMLFLYDGAKLTQISLEFAKGYWAGLREWVLLQWQAYNGMTELPTDFSIPIVFASPETEAYFKEQLEYAEKHNDKSLSNCMERLTHRIKMSSDHIVRISQDYQERSFLFCHYYGGQPHDNGGIIFHGYPDEGYRVANSVQLSPSYGWSTHT